MNHLKIIKFSNYKLNHKRTFEEKENDHKEKKDEKKNKGNKNKKKDKDIKNYYKIGIHTYIKIIMKYIFILSIKYLMMVFFII